MDPNNYDFVDVGISAAVGAFAPGVLSVAKRIGSGYGAISTLSAQAANTANRAAKISQRITAQKIGVAKIVGTQAAFQVGKMAGEKLDDYVEDPNNSPSNGATCGCKK